MRRSIVVAFACLLFAASSAHAMSFGITPELGSRVFTGDAKDLLGNGVTAGATVELGLAPQLALIGHGDIGFHPGDKFAGFSGSQNSDVIDNGASIDLSVGARFYPMPVAETGIEPYVSAQVGLTAIAWTYTDDFVALEQQGDPSFKDNDGLSAVSIGATIGARYFFSSMLGLDFGVGGALHAWEDKTTENKFDFTNFDGNGNRFKGQEINAHGGLVLRFGQ